MNEFVGRSWIVERALGHLAARQDEPLLVVGQPGSGKSALARELVDRIGPGDPSTVVVGHLCHADDDTLLGRGLVEELVAALIRRDGRFAELMGAEPTLSLNATVTVGSAAPDAHVRGINIESLHLGRESARSAFNRLVRKPLENMPDPPAVILIVDALDEARSVDSADGITALLAHLTSGLRRTGLDFRILLTSREVEQPALRSLGGHRVHLTRDAPPESNDLYDYCLARLTSNGTAATPARRLLASRIATRAAGNYLYARHVISSLALDEHDRHDVHLDDISDLRLPEDLSEVYDDFLDRTFASVAWRTVRPILTLLAVARAPGMTPGLLAAATGRRDSEVADALADIGEFTHRQGDAVRLYHESFRAHLLTGRRHPLYPAEAHRDVGTAFLTGRTEAPYLARHYSHHLHQAGMDAELCGQVLATVGGPGTTGSAFSRTELEHLRNAFASAVRIEDLPAVAALLLRRAEAARGLTEDPLTVLADSGPEAADELASAHSYEVGALWQLMIAHKLRVTGRSTECAEHLHRLDGAYRDELPGRLQGLAAVLIAQSQAGEEDGDPATVHGAGLLGEFHTGMLARYLSDLGDPERAMTVVARLESGPTRAKLFDQALEWSAERSGPARARRVAERVIAALPRHSYGRNATVEAAHATALTWVSRADAGSRPGILARLSRFPVEYSAVLASVRPLTSAAGRREAECATGSMELLRARAVRSYERLWVELNGARLARRSGDNVLADRIMRELLKRRPSLLDTEADGHFVSPPHDDSVHGPCLQGLVLETARECVRAGRIADAVGLAREMHAFHGHDSVTLTVDLVRWHHRHGQDLRAVALLDDSLELLRTVDQSRSYFATYLLRLAGELSGSLPEQRITALRAEAERHVRELLRGTNPGFRFDASRMADLHARLARAYEGRADHGRVEQCVTQALQWADLPDPAEQSDTTDLDARYESLAVHLSGVQQGAAARTALERVSRRQRERRVTTVANRLAARGDRTGALALLDSYGFSDDGIRILALAEQRRPEEALRRATDPDVSVRTVLELRRVLLAQGDTERARLLTKRVLEHTSALGRKGRTGGFSDSGREFSLAQLYAHIGRYDKAQAHFRRGGALFSDQAGMWLAMSMSLGGDPYAPGVEDQSFYDSQQEALDEEAVRVQSAFAEAVWAGGQVDRARELVAGMNPPGFGRFGYPFTESGPLALRVKTQAAAACGFLDLVAEGLDQLPSEAPHLASFLALRAPETTYGRELNNLRRIVLALAPYCMGDIDATLGLCTTLLDAAPETADTIYAEVREWPA